MVSAATSRLEGLRGGPVDASTATVVLFLVGGAVFLLIGCLRSTTFAQLTIEGLAIGSVYGSLALALVLVYRATHVINFAQGELAMFTTYIAWDLMQHGLSYWPAFAATLAIAFALGTVLQVTIIRPVQHRSVIAVGHRDRRPLHPHRRSRQLDLGRRLQADEEPVRHRLLRRRRRPDPAPLRRDDGRRLRLGGAGLGAVPLHEARSRDARRRPAAGRPPHSWASASTRCSRSAGGSPPCSARSPG